MDDHSATFSDLFTNAIFWDIVILLTLTIGLYIVASLIHVHGLFGAMNRY
jgi:hypothetical protein